MSRIFVSIVQNTPSNESQGKRYISLYELGNEDWGVMRKPKGASDDQYQYITRGDYVQGAARMAKIIREEAGDDVTIIGVSIDNRQHRNPSTVASELVFAQDAYKYMEKIGQLEIDLVNYHAYWADWFWNGSGNVTKINAKSGTVLSFVA